MVSSGIETVYCIVMASCYEESSNNFSPVVTFKFEIEKITKKIGLKHVYLQASSLDRLFCAEHFDT